MPPLREVAEVPTDIMQFLPFLNTAGLGLMAWFVLTRLEPRMNAIENSIDRLAKAVLLDVASRPGAAPHVKREADALLREVEQNLATRQGDGHS